MIVCLPYSVIWQAYLFTILICAEIIKKIQKILFFL